MKHFVIALLLLSVATAIRAQSPSISYLQVDEAQSHLWVIGSFGTTPGTVTIEDTTLGIVSWSDSMIVCDLPDSGHGAGGHVLVTNGSGTSSSRLLSIVTVRVGTFAGGGDGHSRWLGGNGFTWILSWRTDLSHLYSLDTIPLSFEAGRVSRGGSSSGYPQDNPPKTLQCRDSNDLIEPSINAFGTMVGHNSTITFKQIGLADLGGGHPAEWTAHNLAVTFDSGGCTLGFMRTKIVDTYISFRYDSSLTSIEFAPAPCTLGSPIEELPDPQSQVRITSDLSHRRLAVATTEAFGTVFVSLYSVLGVTLHQETLNMMEPGQYFVRLDDLAHGTGILVLRTDRGQISQKVLY